MKAIAALRAVFAVVAAAACALLGSRASFADVEATLVAGHGGKAVQDSPTPVLVRIASRGESAAVEVTISISAGQFLNRADVRATRTVQLQPGTTRDELFLVPAPSTVSDTVTATLSTKPATIVRAEGRTGDHGKLELYGAGGGTMNGLIPSSAHAIGLHGAGIASLQQTLPEGARTGLAGTVRTCDQVHTLEISPAALALAPLGLQGLETVLLLDPGPDVCASERELDGLLDWVALGGHLVVCLGENAAAFAATPLGAATQVTWGRPANRNYVRIAQEWGAVWRDEDGRPPDVPGPLFPLAAASATAQVTRTGLAVTPYGTGRISVLGFDPRRFAAIPHLRDEPVAALASAITDARPPALDITQTKPTWAPHTEFTGLLRGEAFAPPNAGLVMLALLLYVAVVGPVDWLLLRRMKKERWTTLTFVSSVIVFTLLAWVASLFLFGAERQTNRIVFAQIADGGRPGRLVWRQHDLAAHYLPIGGTVSVASAESSAVLGSTFPGVHGVGSLGTDLRIEMGGTDPLRPSAAVDVAFRSMRIAASTSVGTTGRSLDVTLDPTRKTWTLANNLGTDVRAAVLLESDRCVGHFASIPAGSAGTSRNAPSRLRGGSSMRALEDPRWESLVRVAADAWLSYPTDLDEAPGFRAAGVAAPNNARARRGLVIAVVASAPFPLGDSAPGTQFVVVHREVDLP